MHNFLIGVTGSVAAIRVANLVEALSPLGDVKVVATKAGRYFLEQSGCLELLSTEGPNLLDRQLVLDEDEWPETYELGDKILHIELRRWASCLILAPLDANTLAKSVHGFCDNLLTSVIRAWDWTKPVFLCPAMNTHMWQNPPTAEQIQVMQERGAQLIGPVEKKLACEDIGMGAMAPVETIVQQVNERLAAMSRLPDTP